MPRTETLQIHLLGEPEVLRDGKRVALPQSRKTRALLAYLVATGRPHRRERLCELLWDVADDPRGALRWSLSKLRPLVDSEATRRIVADRDTVAFERHGADVDAVDLQAALSGDLGAIDYQKLVDHAAAFRGTFLEGLDLSDFDDFQAWSIGEREQLRRLHVRLLSELVARAPDAEQALAFARPRVQIDPLDEEARVELVRLLGRTGRLEEAEQQVRAGQRLFAELGTTRTGGLEKAWASLTRDRSQPARATSRERVLPGEPPSEAAPESRMPRSAYMRPFVGRKREAEALDSLIEGVIAGRSSKVALLVGEAGAGKTRLIAEVIRNVKARWGTVLDGAAFEAEVGRPYGPWIDALRRLPKKSMAETAPDLGLLLPELAAAEAADSSRERLYDAVLGLLLQRARAAPPVVVVLDDFQWADEASAGLLHYVARRARGDAVLFVLAARSGDLAENTAASRALRALKKERLLLEVNVGPLDLDAVGVLVRSVSPEPEMDVERIYRDSGGNALFALELARASDLEDVPSTVASLVRDRIATLSPEAADVLRWGAVLGHTFGVARLSALVSLEAETLIAVLEVLERHALLAVVERTGELGGAYTFFHDVVRRVVYGEISEPRRRLMHLRVARLLGERLEGDEELAAEIGRHAALAGEAGIAARACVVAGRRCLRLFANAEAESLTRRGLRYADELAEPDRTKLTLELLQVGFGAKRPDDVGAAADRVASLAERALSHACHEHARLGFLMVSYLRWERGDMVDAGDSSLRAELASRAGPDEQRVAAMGETARCLVLLERDLEHAEALTLEAQAMAKRLGIEATPVYDAAGLLHLHHGETSDAAADFARARELARRDGDRYAEFEALSHLVMTELDRGRRVDARRLVTELCEIGDKLRGGSEAPFARALEALCCLEGDDAEALAELERRVTALRAEDAKNRMAFVLRRLSEIHLAAGRFAAAREAAEEARSVADALDLPTEMALARVALGNVALESGDRDALVALRPSLRGPRFAMARRCARDALSALTERIDVAEAAS